MRHYFLNYLALKGDANEHTITLEQFYLILELTGVDWKVGGGGGLDHTVNGRCPLRLAAHSNGYRPDCARFVVKCNASLTRRTRMR
jgi:hypothetical protein